MTALDPATGKEIWKSGGHAVPYEMNSAARDHGKGPKSTPVVAGGRVYTLGISGVLSAHDAETGRLAWRKEFSKQFPTTSPLYGTSMSPVVEKNLLIAHVGGHDKGALTAFDAKTGAVKWSFEPDGPSYSSPVVTTLGGVRQVVTFTQKEFVSVSADFGELLWKLPAKTSYDTNCNTPVVYKDTIIFALEDGGIVAVRPTKQGKQWTAPEVWRNADNALYMNTPVVARQPPLRPLGAQQGAALRPRRRHRQDRLAGAGPRGRERLDPQPRGHAPRAPRRRDPPRPARYARGLRARRALHRRQQPHLGAPPRRRRPAARERRDQLALTLAQVMAEGGTRPAD